MALNYRLITAPQLVNTQAFGEIDLQLIGVGLCTPGVYANGDHEGEEFHFGTWFLDPFYRGYAFLCFDDDGILLECTNTHPLCNDDEFIRVEDFINLQYELGHVHTEVEHAEKVMLRCWKQYDEAMRRGEDAELDDDYFEAESLLKEYGLKFDPTAC